MYTCTILFSVVWISFSQVSGSVFEDLIESRSKLNVSYIAKVSVQYYVIDKWMQIKTNH